MLDRKEYPEKEAEKCKAAERYSHWEVDRERIEVKVEFVVEEVVVVVVVALDG